MWRTLSSSWRPTRHATLRARRSRWTAEAPLQSCDEATARWRSPSRFPFRAGTLAGASGVAGVVLVDPDVGAPVRVAEPGVAHAVLQVRPGDGATTRSRVVEAA